MNTKTCRYCREEKPVETFVSLRKCGDCGRLRKCYTCGETKNVAEFPQEGAKGCRVCRESGRAKDQRSVRAAERYQLHQERIASDNRAWKIANSETYRAQQKQYAKERREGNRRNVLDYYGGRCACCGEAEPLFLTVDHIDGNGAEHRRIIRKADMWLWLVQMNFPPGFQLLCFNCNAGRYRNGGVCPHKGCVEDSSHGTNA